MKQQDIHKMAQKLGYIIHTKTKGPLTIVGILTGGKYLSRELVSYLKLKKRVVTHPFNIWVNTVKGVIAKGKKLIKNNNTLYLFVDDAVWTSRTRNIVKKEIKSKKIKFKFAVLLDPNRKADFSLFRN